MQKRDVQLYSTLLKEKNLFFIIISRVKILLKFLCARRTVLFFCPKQFIVLLNYCIFFLRASALHLGRSLVPVLQFFVYF